MATRKVFGQVLWMLNSLIIKSRSPTAIIHGAQVGIQHNYATNPEVQSAIALFQQERIIPIAPVIYFMS